MLVLFDHVTPRGIARFLVGHAVSTAKERGWDTLSNGELLTAAEKAQFEVFVTADKNIRYQQYLAERKIAIIALSTPQWPRLKKHVDKIVAAVNKATAGAYNRRGHTV